jgi:hypothetical protein
MVATRLSLLASAKTIKRRKTMRRRKLLITRLLAPKIKMCYSTTSTMIWTTASLMMMTSRMMMSSALSSGRALLTFSQKCRVITMRAALRRD